MVYLFGYKSIGVLGWIIPCQEIYIITITIKCIYWKVMLELKIVLVDVSYHSTVASYYFDVFKIFHHLEYFPKKNIFNLDQYSLTDRFWES